MRAYPVDDRKRACSADGMSARPFDLFDLDAQLSAEERAVRDTVRRFVDDKVMPRVASWYREGSFPWELAPDFAELGLLGAPLHTHGCAGMNATAYWLALRELERADSQRADAAAGGGKPRLQVVGGLGAEVHIALKLRAGLAVGVQDPAGSVEHDDPLAEAVEQGFGEGGKDGRQGGRVRWLRGVHKGGYAGAAEKVSIRDTAVKSPKVS